jgi:cyanophycinase-like exopeptidase
MASSPILPEPGLIVLFGSGETSPTGRKVFDRIFPSLPQTPRLALLETPAGFELNSYQVISHVGDFFTRCLQNYAPQVEIISARKRGTPFSPDEPEIVSPILEADLIFMGPGSPSYAIRQLRDSLAWYYLIARHRLGAILVLASAATVAFSKHALPVYEIYKVGEEIHWIEGLDFFKSYGLQLVFIPHWNNHEGGIELDTSRCFMGQQRFLKLMEILPDEMTIVGLDEKTALIMDPSNGVCQVMGQGRVTLIHTGHTHIIGDQVHSNNEKSLKVIASDEDSADIAEQRHGHVHQHYGGQVFAMQEMGHFLAYHPEASLPSDIWQQALQVAERKVNKKVENPPDEVLQLILERERARQVGDWIAADQLRRQSLNLGWEIRDTNNGPVSRKLSKV